MGGKGKEFTCPYCGTTNLVLDGEVIKRDSHGRKVCNKCYALLQQEPESYQASWTAPAHDDSEESIQLEDESESPGPPPIRYETVDDNVDFVCLYCGVEQYLPIGAEIYFDGEGRKMCRACAAKKLSQTFEEKKPVSPATDGVEMPMDLEEVVLSTTPVLQGYVVEEYIDIVCLLVDPHGDVHGLSVCREKFRTISKEELYTGTVFERNHRIAFRAMRYAAIALGGNAAIGVSIVPGGATPGDPGLRISGTVVRIKRAPAGSLGELLDDLNHVWPQRRSPGNI